MSSRLIAQEVRVFLPDEAQQILDVQQTDGLV